MDENIKKIKEFTQLSYSESYDLYYSYGKDIERLFKDITTLEDILINEKGFLLDINLDLKNTKVYNKLRSNIIKKAREKDIIDDRNEIIKGNIDDTDIINNEINLDPEKFEKQNLKINKIEKLEFIKMIKKSTGMSTQDCKNLIYVYENNIDLIMNDISMLKQYIVDGSLKDENVNERLVRANVYKKIKEHILLELENERKELRAYIGNDDKKCDNSKKGNKLLSKTGKILAGVGVSAVGIVAIGGILVSKSLKKHRMAREISEKTGLSEEDSLKLLKENNNDVELALSNIQSNTNKDKHKAKILISKNNIDESTECIKAYKKLGNDISKYNTRRGGDNGLKGFIFEDMHATDARLKGQNIEVISNNGLADFKIINPDNTITYGQAKVGYKNCVPNLKKYKGQTIITDKGNTGILRKAQKEGLEVIESNISIKKVENLSKLMQMESKVTKKSTSKIVPKLYSGGKVVNQYHKAGISAAKKSSVFGSTFSIGKNMVDIIDGDKSLKEASIDIVKDTALSAGTAYVTGVTSSAVASSALGLAVKSGVAATAQAVTSTTIGTTVMAGVATASNTTIGSAVMATTSVIGGTSVAPVVATGIIAGAGYNLYKKATEESSESENK